MSSARQPVARQSTRQRRVRAAERGRQHAHPRRRDRRLQAVGEAARVGEHAAHRQAERERDVAAHDEQRAAALRLDEAAPAHVVGARALVRRDAHRVELVAGRGRAHVAEADEPLGREVVEAAREHRQRLAGADLVVRLLERDRRGRARGDRVDHRPVGAERRLHGVRGDDVAERLLQAVGLALAVEQVVEQQRGAATPSRPSRALRVADERGMHLGEQLLGRQARVGERLDRAGEVDERHPVGGGEQVGGDAEAREVEAVGQLAGDAARVRDACAGRGSGRPRAAGRATCRRSRRGAPRRARGRRRRTRAPAPRRRPRSRASAGRASGVSTVSPPASTVSSSRSERTPIRAATAPP